MAAGCGGEAMVTPEIETSDITFWWIWQNMGLESALILARASGRKFKPVSDERVAELLEFFCGKKDDKISQ